jgi:hypothetical protein
MADPRESRLPKWAQEQLSDARRKIRELERMNADLRSDVGDTNTHVLNYGSDDQPLPNNARVQFAFPGKGWDQHIQVYVEGGRLRIQGGRTLVIHPAVSNAFWVALGDR